MTAKLAVSLLLCLALASFCSAAEEVETTAKPPVGPPKWPWFPFPWAHPHPLPRPFPWFHPHPIHFPFIPPHRPGFPWAHPPIPHTAAEEESAAAGTPSSPPAHKPVSPKILKCIQDFKATHECGLEIYSSFFNGKVAISAGCCKSIQQVTEDCHDTIFGHFHNAFFGLLLKEHCKNSSAPSPK